MGNGVRRAARSGDSPLLVLGEGRRLPAYGVLQRILGWGLSVFGCQISDWAGSEVRNPKSERGKLHHLTPSLLGFGSLAGWMSIGIWTCRGILYNEPTSVVSPEHGVLRSLAGYP